MFVSSVSRPLFEMKFWTASNILALMCKSNGLEPFNTINERYLQALSFAQH